MIRRVVVVSQLVERLLPTLQMLGLNPVISNFCLRPTGTGPSNYLSCWYSSSSCSGHLVNLLLG